MVAPGGVPRLYEEIKPVYTLNIATKIAVKITTLKPLANLIAKEAGNTNNAETNNTPIVGMMTEIARPVSILNDKDNKFVLIPLVWAVSSSKVNKNKDRLNKTK